MTNRLTLVTILLAGAASLAQASSLTLDPISGDLTGAPGQTVGWGFQMPSDSTNWISFTSSLLLFESDPAVGIYTDLIGLQGGPVNFVLPPNSSDWIQLFDAVSGTGAGSFAIDPGAADGEMDSATLRMLYDEFSADPNTCGNCYIDSLFIDTNVTATALSPTAAPEPAMAGPIGLGLIGLTLLIRRKATAS